MDIKSIIACLIFLATGISLCAQTDFSDSTIEDSYRAPDITLGLEAYRINREGFSLFFGSQVIPGIGAGITIPAGEKFVLKGDCNFYWKNGTSITYHFGSDTTTQSKGGDARFRMFRFHLLGKLKVYEKQSNSFALEGGMALQKSTEKHYSKDGTSGSQLSVDGLIGFVVGGQFEKRLADNYGLTANVRYTFCRSEIKESFQDYGGVNASIGVVYTLKQ